MRVSLSSRKRLAEDKENAYHPRHPAGFKPGNLLCQPNEQFVCIELPVNKKWRPSTSSSSEEPQAKRPQAPQKSRQPYLKPGTLAQMRDAHNKRKRAPDFLSFDPRHLLDAGSSGAPAPSPERVLTGIAPRCLGPACLQRKKLLAPKFSTRQLLAPPLEDSSPVVPMEIQEPAPVNSSDTTLDMLPLELLVRIVCRLDHTELKPVFHVCRSLRQAVVIAQQCHFNFTTPGRDHKTVSDSASQKPDPAASFLSDEFDAFAARLRRLPTPGAPKHAVKAPKTRISEEELRQITATLFPATQPPVGSSHSSRPPTGRGGVSHRVLFNEEELCKAIAQNTL